MTPEQAEALRAEFPPAAIGKLPRAGITLDYVGHAAVTDRLIAVDPEWNWEPVAWNPNGTPLWIVDAGSAVLWIRLTVCGVTRLGVGICKNTATDLEKQLISDALRNAAMRFGVALDLWSKEDLSAMNAGAESDVGDARAPSPAPETAAIPATAIPGSGAPPAFSPGQASLDKAVSRCSSLAAIGVDILAERQAAGLPTVRAVHDEQTWTEWLRLLERLEHAADAEAERATA